MAMFPDFCQLVSVEHLARANGLLSFKMPSMLTTLPLTLVPRG